MTEFNTIIQCDELYFVQKQFVKLIFFLLLLKDDII